MNDSIDRYTQLESTLALAGLEMTVSELHGTLVGAISNHMKSGLAPDLLKLIEPQANTDASRYARLEESLQQIYRQTSEQLLEGKEGFELLLPSEDELLESRVDGLAGWTRGYLLGLLYNNAFSADQIPESGAEIVNDMMQIAEVVAGTDDEQDEDWALAELQEYIKVGAQLIFEFIYAEQARSKPPLQQ